MVSAGALPLLMKMPQLYAYAHPHMRTVHTHMHTRMCIHAGAYNAYPPPPHTHTQVYCAMVILIQKVLLPRFGMEAGEDEEYDPQEDWNVSHVCARACVGVGVLGGSWGWVWGGTMHMLGREIERGLE